MPRRSLSAAVLGTALALFVLPLAGCEGGASPYEDEGAEATEGTGEVPDGALNRALDPGDAGTVGEANLADPPPADDDSDDDRAAAGDAGVSAKVVDYDGFRAELAGLRGSVVLVDAWATWCRPCREGFPHTVELERKLADRGVKVVSLAGDVADDHAAVEEFLTEQNAGRLINLRADDGGDVDGPWAPLDLGVMPTLLVYDAAGAEVARLTGGEATEANLDAALQTALKAAPDA